MSGVCAAHGQAFAVKLTLNVNLARAVQRAIDRGNQGGYLHLVDLFPASGEVVPGPIASPFAILPHGA